MKIDDELKKEMAYFGYKKCTSKFFESNDFYRLKGYFIDLPYIDQNISNFKIYDKVTLIKYGKYFLNRHLGDANKEVRYLEFGSLNHRLRKKFGVYPSKENYEKIGKYVNKKSMYVNAYEVPLTIINAKNRELGSCYQYNFDYAFNETGILKKLPVVETGVEINASDNHSMKSTYIHELYHMLLFRNKGYTSNLLYEEFIPYFVQKVSSIEISDGVLESDNIYRLNILSNFLNNYSLDDNYYDKVFDAEYIMAFVLSENLFIKYISGSDKIKKEIDSYIKNVVTGKKRIEDLLEKFNITPEEGSKILINKSKKLRREEFIQKN